MSSSSKDVIRRLNRGFEEGNEEAILACLNEDIVWHVPPYFTARGKQAFRAQISSPDADGPPAIELRSVVEEGEMVAVEGYVTNRFKSGSLFRGLFHNAYRLRDGKVSKMTSYVVPLPESGWDPEVTR